MATIRLLLSTLALATFLWMPAARADPVDPWTAPPHEVAAEYNALNSRLAELNSQDELDPDEIVEKDLIQRKLQAFRAAMEERSIDATAAGASAGPQTAETPASAGEDFFFDGLVYGTPDSVPEHEREGAEAGVGAAWFVICVQVKIEGDNGELTGTLEGFDMHAFAFSFMRTDSIVGLRTAVHELEHVRQFKFAWEGSRDAFRDEFPVTGDSEDAVRKAVEEHLRQWFRQHFNRLYTGHYFTSGVLREFERVTGMDPNEAEPHERTTRIEETKFDEQYDDEDLEAAQRDVAERNRRLVNEGANPDLRGTTPSPGGLPIRVKLRLFRDDGQNGQEKSVQPRDDAKKEKEVGFLPEPYQPREEQEFASRVAIQTPGVCVASTYFVSETLVTETRTSGASLAMATPHEVPEDFGIPVCTPTPTLVSAPPPEAPQTPEDPPEEPPQETPAAAPPEEPPQQETPVATPPEETPRPEEDETPDLGLVKAAQSVVTIALSDSETGEPVVGGTVKLLTTPPALPAQTPAPVLASSEAYESDVAAALVDEAGEVTITLAAVPDEAGVDTTGASEPDEAGESPESADDIATVELVEVEEQAAETQTGTGTEVESVVSGAAAGEPAPQREIRIASQPPEQFVLATKSPEARMPAALAATGGRICVNRTFRIGATPVYVVDVPQPEAEAFAREVAQWEDLAFFEPDPCRQKEEIGYHPAGRSGLNLHCNAGAVHPPAGARRRGTPCTAELGQLPKSATR